MRKITYLLFVVAFMFTCSNAFSQTQVVMKALNGTVKLNGGSTVPGHTNEIDLFSYSQGETSCPACQTANVSDLSVLMALNAATISFKKLLLNGTKLTSIDLTYIKGGGTPIEYYKIHMENVLVSSVQESGSSEIPTLSVSLTPDKIAWQQTTDAGKKSSYGWDVLNNVEWIYNFQ